LPVDPLASSVRFLAAYAGCSLYRHHRAACRLIFEKSLICRGRPAPDATAPDPQILPKV